MSAKPVFLQEDMLDWFSQLNDNTFPLSNDGGIMTLLAPKFIGGSAEERIACFSFPVQNWQLNPENTLHGGILATYLDTAFGITCHYFAQKEMVCTINMQTTFLKPLFEGNNTLCTIKINSLGKNIVTMSAEARREHDDVLAATATATFMIIHPSR